MFRTAVLSDIEALMQIECYMFEPLFQFKPHQFRYLISKGRGELIVFDYMLHAHRVSPTLGGYAYLSMKGRLYSIAVKPNNCGMGRALLCHMEKRCVTPRIYLEVWEKNSHAINFYRVNDYTSYDIKQNYYGDGRHAILMHKDLYHARDKR